MAAQFSWAAAADVGMGVASAISSWGTTSANRIVQKANADAQRVVRDAQNKERAANTSLAGTMRSLSYRAALTNAGNASDSAGMLLARTQEAWTSRNFEQNLKNVEQMGAFAARTAAAGVGGASVRAVSSTVQLQQDRLTQAEQSREGQQTYEFIRQRSGIMPAAASRLDLSPLSPNIDYSSSYTPAGNSGNLLAALTEGVLSKGKSLQVALDSIQQDGKPDTSQLPTGDFSRMDRGQTSSILID